MVDGKRGRRFQLLKFKHVTSFWTGKKPYYDGPRCKFLLTTDNSRLIETTVPGFGCPRALVWLRVADTDADVLHLRQKPTGPRTAKLSCRKTGYPAVEAGGRIRTTNRREKAGAKMARMERLRNPRPKRRVVLAAKKVVEKVETRRAKAKGRKATEKEIHRRARWKGEA